MSRKIARQELFKIVFEAEINGVLPNTLLDQFLSREDVILSPKGKEFLTQYVEGISAHNDELNKLIEEKMTGWNLERIGNVEKALLKCAAYELKYETTGHEIVANEAIELAKVYGDEKSHEFINGVLANIIKG